jgi:hypothetical protein
MIMNAVISKQDFQNCTHTNFEKPMVKLVADLGREILAYDAPWHADLEAELIADGSVQGDLWGFNFYYEADALEYNSLINIRPLVNRSMDIQDPEICGQVERVFLKWVKNE